MIDVDADERRWSEYMAAAHRGDSRLYERLLGELASVIAAYVRSRFGTLFFTEDCVQECLIAIHNARHTYDPLAAVSALAVRDRPEQDGGPAASFLPEPAGARRRR